MNLQETQQSTEHRVGTLDGAGSADHDHPYVFGRRPCSAAPFPFSTRQYVRLLLMRSRLAEKSLDSHMSDCDHLPIQVGS
jgi:hypothetical protein